MQIIRARCTNADIGLILPLRGLQDSQRKYWPVKVGIRYTLIEDEDGKRVVNISEVWLEASAFEKTTLFHNIKQRCSSVVKTSIDPSTLISTTQIAQTKRHQTDCDSAIGQHLLDNDQFASNYDNKRFSILATARSSFHLNLLEAAYIKTRRPVLWRQRVCLHSQNSFDNRGVLTWPLSALSLAFRYCEIFLWRAS